MSSRSSQAVGGRRRVCCAEPVQPAQILDLLAYEHARVQPTLLGHVTETAALSSADRRAVPPDRPGIEIGETEDGPHGRRLAGTVGPEEADDLPGGDLEGEVVESGQLAVGPAQSLQLQRSAHYRRLLDYRPRFRVAMDRPVREQRPRSHALWEAGGLGGLSARLAATSDLRIGDEPTRFGGLARPFDNDEGCVGSWLKERS